MPDFSTAHRAIEHTGLLKYVHGCISHFLCQYLISLILAEVVKINHYFPMIFRVKAVTDGILKLIKDQKNGRILKVSANGTDYVPE